jgi:phi13 family phage major tail protein
MATIGLDKPFYAKITEDENDNESYGTPKVMAKAIDVDLSIELLQAILYADDSADVVVNQFKQGTFSIGINDLAPSVAADLLGTTVDKNGAVVYSIEDVAEPVAVGFRALKPNGKYRYFWLYKVTFSVPSDKFETKKDSINFQTPQLTGTVTRRNKPDSKGKHQWKTEITEGEDGVSDSVISGWFDEVYEPDYTAAQSNSQQSGS